MQLLLLHWPAPSTFESSPVPPHRKRSARVVGRQAAGLLLLLALAVGCSSKTLEETPPTIEPARPADSPALSQHPAGVVRPLAGKAAAAPFDGPPAALVNLTS